MKTRIQPITWPILFLLAGLIAVGVGTTNSGGNLITCLQMNAAPKIATSSSYYANYNGELVNASYGVYFNDSSHSQNLREIIPTQSGQYSLITGVDFWHNESTAPGPFDINVNFMGTTYNTALNISDIPASASGTWYSYRIPSGSPRLISNNPTIDFLPDGTVLSNDCLSIGLHNGASGHSYFQQDGTAWQALGSAEFLVKMYYEPISYLVPWGGAKNGVFNTTGSLNNYDIVDAYNVTLTVNHNYLFTLSQVSGSGDAHMRLSNVSQEFVGNFEFNSTLSGSLPRTMQYNSSTTKNYTLLVEAVSGSGVLQYSVKVIDLTPGYTVPYAPTLEITSTNPSADNKVVLVWISDFYSDNFTLYRSTTCITSLSGLTALASVARSPYTDTLTNAGTYYYVVIATNIYGDSAISNCVKMEFTGGIAGFDVLLLTCVSVICVLAIKHKRFKHIP